MNKLRKKRKNRVTIIVGIICKGGIVLASDSQSTAGNVKRTDSSKISHLKFAGKDVLVAQAGDCDMGSRTIELMDREFKTVERFGDYRQPADAAQKAVSLLKKELVEINNWQDRRDLEEDYLDNNRFTLMLAYYFGNEPCLYVLNSVPGFATREYKFAAIGCGGTVGEFILSRSNASELEPSKALVAAIYTVEEVKKVDAFCGGPTKAAAISPNTALLWENAWMKCTLEGMAQYEEIFRQNWEQLLEKMMLKVADYYFERFPDELRSLRSQSSVSDSPKT